MSRKLQLYFPQIEYLISNFKKSGQDVKIVKHRGKAVGASTINSLQRLFDKQKITQEQLKAAERYSIDYERSNLSNYAKSNWNNVIHYYNLDSEEETRDNRFEASKRINEIRMLVAKEFSTWRSRKIRRKFKQIFTAELQMSNGEKVLRYVFEGNVSLRHAEECTGINHSTVEIIAIRICEIIFDFYKNYDSIKKA